MKKAIVSILLASMLLSLASCSTGGNNTDEPEKAQPEQTGDEIAVEEETEYRYYADLPEKDLGGRDFRIISRVTASGHDVQQYTDYGNNEIDAEEMNGTQINDVVYTRNRELEDRYKFVFVSYQPDSNPMATARKSITAGSDDYDAVVDSLAQTCDYTLLYNMSNIDSINLSADCWDQNVNRSLSVANKHYVAVGDMLILDKKGTWCHLFNKPMAANLGLPNLYDMVREGTWIMDEFYSMAQMAAGDTNGNGIMDEADTWGFLTEGYNINILMFGGDTHFTAKDENDYPVVDLFSDRTVSVFETAHKIMVDKNVSLSMSWSKNGPADCLKAFSEDRGLFYMTGVGTAMEFRYMDSDFGILPIPKYDAAQENYHTSLSNGNSATVCIPKSCQTPEDVGFILQATCQASTTTLKTTFYDTVLSGVTVRDEESRDMLDIIFANRVFDLGFINGWGISDIYTSLLNSSSDVFASTYERKQKSITKMIEKAIKAYDELD